MSYLLLRDLHDTHFCRHNFLSSGSSGTTRPHCADSAQRPAKSAISWR